ncbi:unnamed protein product [Rotaria sp. Silwood1]|nr:unnamed protein product [Rotaria sp. Silwood1]
MLLTIYIERVNPGEFGVAQPWNYLFRKSFWNHRRSSTIEPSDLDLKEHHPRLQDTSNDQVNDTHHWIQLTSLMNVKSPSLAINHLTKKFGKLQAVSDLSLDFYEGEVCSLLGHNGAGKTTTTFILVGMLEPTSGSVTVQGMDNREHIQEVRKLLGFCPQYEYEYRIFMDKQETCDSRHVTRFIREHVKNAVLERGSASELVYGIKRDESNKIERLINALDQHRQSIGINSYGLSMTTIEDVFLNVLPTPEEIQSTLLQNDRIIDAQVTLLPSIYNPQTIVTYSNNNESYVPQRLLNYLINAGAIVDEISNDNVLEYILPKYYQSEDAFVNQYKMGFASYNDPTAQSPILKFNTYFSTVNYHTMPTSLGIAVTNLFQFYANSSAKSIVTTNQPIAKTVTVLTAQARAFQNLLCFDSLPVSIGATANSKTQSEVYIYRNTEETGYFFLMFLMYSLASLPFIYTFSFGVKRELIGVINFFLLNVLICFADMILSFLATVAQEKGSSNQNGTTAGATAVTTIRWILSGLLPTVNLKHALSNIRLRSNRDCIKSFNSIMGTNYAFDEPWMSVYEPDEDVRIERESILKEYEQSTSTVILVRDLVKQFTKRKEKSLTRRIYTAVDHLNFRVSTRSCFGLLGANGAGKTTTFRILIDNIKPTSGEIIINGKNISKMKRDLEIGFCPQFDWLVDGLNVTETVILFASGGNKRKLSAVIAFMANPALVFLDEPTTGLDAAAKRKLWAVIRSARDIGITIIMTSHSMEECEALCTRIGIMKLGQFMCLGNLQHLKNRFGDGYAVQVKVSIDKVQKIKDDLTSFFPEIEIQDQHDGMLFCNIPFSSTSSSPLKDKNATTSTFNLVRIFAMLNAQKNQKLIESYSLSQTTLEQIFVRLAGDDEDNISTISSNKEPLNQTEAADESKLYYNQ